VGDCISAVLTALETAPERPVHIFNLGTDDYCEVADSASWICSKLGLSPEFTFGGGKRGWIGDSPFIFLDTKRIRALGRTPKLTIKQSVERIVEFLAGSRA
jgi:UDP-glucose 4-epimerase